MVMSTAMSSEGDAVKVEGGHVSVTTISMSGPETSNGKVLDFLRGTCTLCCVLFDNSYLVLKIINLAVLLNLEIFIHL